MSAYKKRAIELVLKYISKPAKIIDEIENDNNESRVTAIIVQLEAYEKKLEKINNMKKEEHTEYEENQLRKLCNEVRELIKKPAHEHWQQDQLVMDGVGEKG